MGNTSTRIVVVLMMLFGCSPAEPPLETMKTEPAAAWDGQSPPVGVATPTTAARNAGVTNALRLGDPVDMEDVNRGFLAALDTDIRNSEGDVVWQVDAWDFLEGESPSTVNPSLWRQSRLAAQHGLFEVKDGIYQVRGYDIAVVTFIRGKTGWIVVDPLFTQETAAAALDLVNQTLGQRPVSAVIYTHSHADHFGGARGVIKDRNDMVIIAPEGFADSAVAENLLAGSHMARRSTLMFGNQLERSPTGHVGTGIGPAMSANGNVSLILPSEEIPGPIATRVVDGVTFEFLNANGTEAPAKFVFFLPEFEALCTAEIATGTFHNVLTLRGSKARDTLRWSKVLDDILVRYANRADVAFGSHHWPTWGANKVRDHLRRHRDIYRYVHDQTLRRANSGATLHEIAEVVGEPTLAQEDFSVRDYYGTLNHNLKAVYQYYFGWWDGVPANFHLLPPVQRAERFVTAMGGVDDTIEKGVDAFRQGDYRWAAEILNQAVFAASENGKARDWLAAAYEQIGFQAESGAWRNYYLSAAQELRLGKPESTGQRPTADFVAAVPTIALFDALAARFTPGAAAETPYTLLFVFTDRDEAVTVEVGKDAVFPRLGRPQNEPAAVFETKRSVFDLLVLGEASAPRLMLTGELTVDGDRSAVSAFFDALDTPNPDFEVVAP